MNVFYAARRSSELWVTDTCLDQDRGNHAIHAPIPERLPVAAPGFGSTEYNIRADCWTPHRLPKEGMTVLY